MISLPQWYKLPEMWDCHHDVIDADDHADAYSYRGIAIDIEGSQLWDSTWGELVANKELD